MDDDPNVLKFLEHASLTCAEHGVFICFKNQQYFFINRKKVSAFFTPPRPERLRGKIAIALTSGGHHWVHQLMHEYGHFEQWSEQSALWLTKEFALSQIPLLGNNMVEFYKHKRALELDCERRAVRIITEWSIPIDVSSYIQYSNMHIWSYTLLIEHLKQPTPLKKKKFQLAHHLVAHCPKEFLDNYDDVPDFLRESARRRSS